MELVDRLVEIAGKHSYLTARLSRSAGPEFQRLLKEMQSSRTDWKAVRTNSKTKFASMGAVDG